MIRPKQKLPFSKKNAEFIEQNAFYWDAVCKNVIDDNVADLLYGAANGELDEDQYTYVTNPLNTECDKHKRFPSKMRNMDIINPIVTMLMGEKRRRGINFTTIARNSDIDNIRKQAKEKLVDENLVKMFVGFYASEAEKAGQEVDLEQMVIKSEEEIDKQVNSIPDRVAIMGQESIDYIIDYNNSFRVFLECWYHFIVTGCAFTYRDIYRDEVIHKSVPPREMKIYAYSDVNALEEAEAQVRVLKMSINQVIDKFQDIKGYTQEIEDELSARLGYTTEAASEIRHLSDVDPGQVAFTNAWRKARNTENDIYSDEDGIEVKHIVWTSLVKIGLLTTSNIFGETITEEVDEDFIPLEGEEIEWKWVEQKWHCYLLDNKHVVGGEPLLNCQGNFYSPKAKRSVYNGKILGFKHTSPRSLVARGIDYQIKYNIVHYYIERLMAKNMDNLVVVPMSLLPEKEGLDMEASMYYAYAMGFLFVDDSNPKSANALNGLKSLNLNLGQVLTQYYSILESLKAEWEVSVGTSPQRKGQMNASDGKAVTENALFRSSIMTEEYFAELEELQEDDLNALLEYSKYAFSEGKKAMYITRDLKAALLDVDGTLINYGDYLVRISSSAKDLDELNQAKGLAQAFAQNAQGRFTPALKAIKGNNISQLIETLEVLENDIQKEQEAIRQADRESAERIAENARLTAEAQVQIKRYEIDENNATKIEIKRMDVEQKTLSEFYNPENAEGDSRQVIENSMNRTIELEKIKADERKSQRDADAKKYQADKQFQIAKENKSM